MWVEIGAGQTPAEDHELAARRGTLASGSGSEWRASGTAPQDGLWADGGGVAVLVASVQVEDLDGGFRRRLRFGLGGHTDKLD